MLSNPLEKLMYLYHFSSVKISIKCNEKQRINMFFLRKWQGNEIK
jgi:hypothetical protein